MEEKSCLVASLILVGLSGCVETHQEASEILHEEATIVEVVYTPSRHDTSVGLTGVKMGSIGMDYGGNMGVRIGGDLQVNSVKVPEKFAVVFRCKHGKFIIQRKEIYEKFKLCTGSGVDVTYLEIYDTTYGKKNGKREVMKRVLVDYDFLDASLKKGEETCL